MDHWFVWVFVIGYLIWQAINAASKAARSGSSISLTSSSRFSEGEQQTLQPAPIHAPIHPTIDSSLSEEYPVRWSLVRQNLSLAEINECFDVAALSRGVSLQDLPKYVHLDKLSLYFPGEELSEIVDLGFFAPQLNASVSPISQPAATPMMADTLSAPAPKTSNFTPVVPGPSTQKPSDLSPLLTQPDFRSMVIFWQIMQPCHAMRRFRWFRAH